MAAAFVITVLALLGALMSYLAGALFYARAFGVRGPVRPQRRWLSVAFLACTRVAGTAGAGAVNLQRLSAKG